MYYLCTGKPPFDPESAIEINDDFNIYLKLQNY